MNYDTQPQLIELEDCIVEIDTREKTQDEIASEQLKERFDTFNPYEETKQKWSEQRALRLESQYYTERG